MVMYGNVMVQQLLLKHRTQLKNVCILCNQKSIQILEVLNVQTK